MAIRIGRDIWLWRPPPRGVKGHSPTPGSLALRRGVHINLAVKTNGDYIRERQRAVGLWVNLREPVGRLTHPLTYNLTNSLPLSFIAAARKAPGTNGEKLN